MRLIILLMAILLTGCATSYGRGGLANMGGYSDKQIAEGTWEVTFRTNGRSPRGFAANAALYRSAELAREAGFPYFQVLRSRGTTTMVGSGYGPPSTYAGETVNLKVRGAQSPDGELVCENDDGRECMTLSTEKVLLELEAAVKPSRSPRPTTS